MRREMPSRCCWRWRTAIRGYPGISAIDFRIAINLGNVIIQGDDVYRDGVNVAERLEETTEPGGIRVFEQIEGRLDLRFDDLGDRQLKKISRPSVPTSVVS